MSTNPLKFRINLDVSDSTDEHTESITRSLFKEISHLNIEKLERLYSDVAPVGAKSLEPMIIGSFLVSIAPTLIDQLLTFLNRWASRNQDSTIRIAMQLPSGDHLEIEVPKDTTQEEVGEWIDLIKSKIITNKSN